MVKPECSRLIFWFGKYALKAIEGTSSEIEAFVTAIRRLSGQKVDWHYTGGQAFIRTTGNVGKVLEAAKRLIPDFNLEVRH